MLMGFVHKDRLVHYYLFNGLMRSSINKITAKSVRINVIYSRILFVSYFFLDKNIMVLLDQEHPTYLLKELMGLESNKYSLCMNIINRVFDSLDNFGLFVTFVLSGFIYDCLSFNNTKLLNDSIYSLKEFSVVNYMALNFGRYNTLVWLDDLRYLIENKSLDELRFRRFKEQLFC